MTRRAWLLSFAGAGLLRAGSAPHLDMELTLRRAPGPWWKPPLGDPDVDGVLVSWGVSFLDDGGRVLLMSPSLSCSQDPFCTGWDSAGRCQDLYAEGHPEWNSAYSCYAANRTMFFDKPVTLFEGAPPPEATVALLRFYRREAGFERRPWLAASGEATVEVCLADANRVEVDLELVAGPDGNARDLRVVSCHSESDDPGATLDRLIAGKQRTCRLLRNAPDTHSK